MRTSDQPNRRSAIRQRNRWSWLHKGNLHLLDAVSPEFPEIAGALTIKDRAMNDHNRFAVDRCCCFCLLEFR
jgi:hypothetical protein